MILSRKVFVIMSSVFHSSHFSLSSHRTIRFLALSLAAVLLITAAGCTHHDPRTGTYYLNTIVTSSGEQIPDLYSLGIQSTYISLSDDHSGVMSMTTTDGKSTFTSFSWTEDGAVFDLKGIQLQMYVEEDDTDHVYAKMQYANTELTLTFRRTSDEPTIPKGSSEESS